MNNNNNYYINNNNNNYSNPHIFDNHNNSNNNNREENWKSTILFALVERNRSQSGIFQPVLLQNETLRKRHLALMEHNKALEKELENLKNTIIILQDKNEKKTIISQPQSNGRNFDLESRILSLQEELTNCYKRNSENAQNLLEATTHIQDLQNKLLKKDEELEGIRNSLERSEEVNKKLKLEITSKAEELSVGVRELQSLNMGYQKLQSEKEQFEFQYNEILTRYLELKAVEADRMNAANALYDEVSALKKKEELQRASRATIDNAIANNVNTSFLLNSNFDVLPSKVPSSNKKSWAGHKDEINYVSYSLVTSKIVTGSTDKLARIWDRNGQLLTTLSGSSQSLMSVRFSPNEEFVLGASNDNSARLWSAQLGRIKHTFTGHFAKVYAATFSYDGQQVISGSHDRNLKVWDMNKGFCVKTICCFSSCNDVVVAADGSAVASAHFDGNIRLWDIRSGECGHLICGIPNKQITSLSTTPANPHLILSNCRDDTLRLYDLRTFEVVQSFSHENYQSGNNWSRSNISPDGAFVAVGSRDGKLYFWNTLTGKCDSVLSSPTGQTVNSVCWNPNSENFCSVDKSGSISLWE